MFFVWSYEAKSGSPAYRISPTLRVYCMQLFYSLSDPVIEDAPYEMEFMLRLAGWRLSDSLPDEKRILNFRHLLVKQRSLCCPFPKDFFLEKINDRSWTKTAERKEKNETLIRTFVKHPFRYIKTSAPLWIGEIQRLKKYHLYLPSEFKIFLITELWIISKVTTLRIV